MRRVADYVVEFLAERGIDRAFLVTGGAAMHLNDAIGRNRKIRYTCCHHEQACAMAAEGYFRVSGRMALVQVTAGPGGINALNGVFGAWTDSIPMVVISGQSRRETLVGSTGLPLRQLGDQEVDIVRMVRGITKYACEVRNPNRIRYHLEKAIYLATQGRPGPVWLDVPIDIQGAPIRVQGLPGWSKPLERKAGIRPKIRNLLIKIRKAQRPVIYAGSGVRNSGQQRNLLDILAKLGIPAVAAWNSNDLIPSQHSAYAGRPGTIGDRPGNFCVQNSDLLLILGCRMNIRQVSYNWKSFAPRAYKVMVDVDRAELKKPTLVVHDAIHADLKVFLPALSQELRGWRQCHLGWMAWCKERVKKYPVVLPQYWKKSKPINPYCFMEILGSFFKRGEIVVCADGTACVTAFQALPILAGMRLFHNSGCASMGYDLPAAIGAALAKPGQRIICLAGDGSIMMNLQELQTIRFHNLPVKIFLLNNHGYHSIRQTQRNFFPDRVLGCGPESGLGFPNFRKVAASFELPFARARTHRELAGKIRQTLSRKGPAVCEIQLDLNQEFAPKTSSQKLPNGTLVTARLENMSPFLTADELRENTPFLSP